MCVDGLMIFEHENSYVKQIMLYYKNEDYEKACDLCREFAAQFPKSLMSHYLLAKSCYRKRDFPAALMEGHRAFNLADSDEDKVATAVFIACVCYELRRFTNAYEILKSIESINDARVEQALIIFSLITNQPETSMLHIDALYKINRDVADQFVTKALDILGQQTPA